ncbi:MAG: PqqD family protein [Planctomycetota bacterium]
MNEDRYKVKEGIVFDLLDDEVGLIIDSENNGAYEVTETVCSILKFINKGATFNRIMERILDEYDVEEKTAAKDLVEILDELLRNKIIEKI